MTRHPDASGAAIPRADAHARRCDLAAALLIAAFVLVSAHGLGTVPTIHDDESWIAQPGVTLWREGRLGADMLRGFAGSETQYYYVPPLYTALVGLVLEVAGIGLVQARAVSLALAAVALAGTYLAGRRLLSPGRGLLAIVIAAAWPVAQPGSYDLTGIPLVDWARLVRYDIGVPAFASLALLVAAPLWDAAASGTPLSAAGAGSPAARHRRAALAGLLCACASSCHVYGGVWIIVLAGVTALSPRRDLARAATLVAAWAIGMLPWVLFVAIGWSAAREQAVPFPKHFTLGSASAILGNVTAEWRRYVPLVRAVLDWSWAAPVWMAAILVSLAGLLPRLRHRDPASLLLAGALAAHGVLFALLLGSKQFRYLASVWPVLALLAADGVAALWLRARSVPGRLAVAAAIAAATAGGAPAIGRLWRDIDRTVPFAELSQRLAQHVPPGARVLALQHYWLALQGHVASYRSLQVPLYLSDPRYVPAGPTFAQAARGVEADTFLVDPILRRFLTAGSHPSHPFHWLATDVSRYLADDWMLRSRFEGAGYGGFEIYEPRGGPPVAAPAPGAGR